MPLIKTNKMDWENPAIVVGDALAEQDDGKVVVRQVSVNLDIVSSQGDSNRIFSSARPLQEVPLLRKLYAFDSVVIRPDWAPRLSRVKAFTKGQFLEEKRRLYGSTEVGHEAQPAYMLVRENKIHNLTEEVYGAYKDSTLYRLMKEMFAAWEAMEERLRAAVLPILQAKAEEEYRAKKRPQNKVYGWEIEIAVNAKITRDDIEAIVAIAAPREDFIEEMVEEEEISEPELRDEPKSGTPGAAAATAAKAPAAEEDKEPEELLPLLDAGDEGDLTSFLIASGIKEDAAQAFALLAADLDEGVITEISSEQWQSVPGYTKHVKKQEALLRLRQDFRAKHAAVEG